MNKAHHIFMQWVSRQWQVFVGVKADCSDYIGSLHAANDAMYQENLEHTPL